MSIFKANLMGLCIVGLCMAFGPFAFPLFLLVHYVVDDLVAKTSEEE